jgi:hypothetical protein
MSRRLVQLKDVRNQGRPMRTVLDSLVDHEWILLKLPKE